MNNTNASPFSIVVGLDFRDAGGYAFAQAARIASAIPNSNVHLVHVFEKELDATRRAELIGQLRLYANEEAAAFGGLAAVRVAIHLRVGDPARAIAQLASDVGANMIVVGAEKSPHLKNWLLGSVSHRLVAAASCPVLVAGPRPPVADPALAIDPPCADCLRARAESNGAAWWCARHTEHGDRAQLFSYQRGLPLSSHDASVIPTGIDF